MFDSNAFSDNVPLDDISRHQTYIRVAAPSCAAADTTGKCANTDQQYSSFLDQIPKLVDQVIEIVQEKAKDCSFEAKRAKIVVVFYFKAVYVGSRSNSAHEAKLSSHSIDFCNLLYRLKSY